VTISLNIKRLQSLQGYGVFLFLCLLLLALFANAPAQAKTSKQQISSFEYYLNLHQQAQQVPTAPRYSMPAPLETVEEVKATEEKTEAVEIKIDDPTAPIEPEPLAYTTAKLAEPVTPQLNKTPEISPTPGLYSPTLKTKPIGIIAIIIDDIGNQEALDERVARLPGAVTLAVLPHTPHSKSVAQLAHSLNKDVMLHAPMESENHRRLGDGALTQDLGKEQFEAVLQESINAIPHVIGVNNHMGSLLTQNDEAMNWVMNIVQRNNLFFVDSRTSPDSVAGKLAKQYNIPTLSRHVFLDNEQSYEYVDKAFQKTLNISKKTGFALAIGHPYPSTVSYLEAAIPKLAEQGYQLVPVSYVLAQKMQTAQTNEAASSIAKK